MGEQRITRGDQPTPVAQTNASDLPAMTLVVQHSQLHPMQPFIDHMSFDSNGQPVGTQSIQNWALFNAAYDPILTTPVLFVLNNNATANRAL